MTRYAATTNVSVEKSRNEIERTLRRFGADGFAYGWEGTKAAVSFRMSNRQVRFVLPLPERKEFLLTPTGQGRSDSAVEKAWEQACRQRWRALKLVILAKLESIESGIEEFDQAFLAHIVLPDGTTTGAWMRTQIEQAYESGEMPSMLPALGSGE